MRFETVPASELMLKRGGSVNPLNHPEETFELLSISAFDKGEPEILKGKDIGSSKSCIQPNDVLISKIVPHIKRCCVVRDPIGNYRQIGSGEWIIFRSPKFYPDYLKHFLSSDIFHKQFMNTTAGVGGSLVRARPAGVEKIEIPIPPLEEQKRIAAILDKADAIRRKRQEAIKLADEFLRAVFLDMFGDPLKWDTKESNGWDIKPIGEICYLKRGYDLPIQDRKDGQYPIYAANGIVGFHDISMAKGPGVITGRSGTLGKVIYTDNDYWPLNTSLYVKDFCGNEPKYIEWFLRLFRLDRYHRGAGVPTLNRNLFLEELTLRPPLELQIDFVKKINKAEALINKMASNIDKDFFNALSQKVFSIN